MVINEKGLLHAMKRAFKEDGYVIARHNDDIVLSTSQWKVVCAAKNFPRKALGMIAEHLGSIPAEGEAFQVKDKETQTKLMEVAMESFRGMTPEDAAKKSAVAKTQIICGGKFVWQEKVERDVYWVSPANERIMFYQGRDVYAIREDILAVSGNTSTVLIAADIPMQEDKRLLDQLARIQLT